MRSRLVMLVVFAPVCVMCLSAQGKPPKLGEEILGTWELVSEAQGAGAKGGKITAIKYEFTVGKISRRAYIDFPSEQDLAKTIPKYNKDRVTAKADGTVSYEEYFGILGYEFQIDPAGRLFTPFGKNLLKITKLASGNIMIDDGDYRGEYRRAK